VLDFEFLEKRSVLLRVGLVCLGKLTDRDKGAGEPGVLGVTLLQLVGDVGVNGAKLLQVDLEVPCFLLVPF
jgi:hypothetical protein